jgi:hypothetical protein
MLYIFYFLMENEEHITKRARFCAAVLAVCNSFQFWISGEERAAFIRFGSGFLKSRAPVRDTPRTDVGPERIVKYIIPNVNIILQGRVRPAAGGCLPV